MSVKIGINGSLGDSSIEIVAVNDVTDPKTLAHLLKYDSILGNLPNTVTAGVDSIYVDNRSTKVFKMSDPAEIDWSSVGAQIVIEATGHFTTGAAALSIIPTSIGAAKALHLVIPELEGRLYGYSLRVPTPDVSIVDLTVMTERPTTAESVNAAFRKAAEGPMKGILALSEEELVSIDFRGNSNSAIVDVPYTHVVGTNCVKVVAWYDNEWGFSCRCRDLVDLLAKNL